MALAGNKCYEMAMQFRKTNQMLKCIEYHEMALGIRLEEGDDLQISNSYQQLGEVYFCMHDIPKAIEFGNMALSLREPRLMADSHQLVGNAHYANRNYEGALDSFLNALQLRKQFESGLVIAQSHFDIGQVSYRMQKYLGSMKHYRKSLNIVCKQLKCKQANIPEFILGLDRVNNTYTGKLIEMVSQKSDIYLYNEEYIEWLREMHRACFTQAEDSYIQIGVGLVILCFVNLKIALSEHQSILESKIVEYGDNHTEVADAFENVGLVYYGTREYKKSLVYFKQSLQLRKNLLGKYHPKLINSHERMGDVYMSMKEYRRAFKFYERSMKLMKKEGMDARVIQKKLQIVYNRMLPKFNL